MSGSGSLDVLAFGAHPDDVELWCGGIVCSITESGYSAGVVDLTGGELGSRGTPEVRREEAAAASEIMALSARENLGISDGDIADSMENRLKVIRTVRKFRPRVVLAGAPHCRHPDHDAATRLVVRSLFYSGLRKVETAGSDGESQRPFRPDHVLHYMQALLFTPTLVVDVSHVWDRRMEAVRAYASQFFNPDYAAEEDEPETFVSTASFLRWIEARARTLGYAIGADYAEGLLYRSGPMGVSDLMRVLERSRVHK